MATWPCRVRERGPGERCGPDGARGLLPSPLAGRKRRRRLGVLLAVKGEAAAAATAGTPAVPLASGVRRRRGADDGVQLGLPWALGILQGSLGLLLVGLGELCSVFCPPWGSWALR